MREPISSAGSIPPCDTFLTKTIRENVDVLQHDRLCIQLGETTGRKSHGTVQSYYRLYAGTMVDLAAAQNYGRHGTAITRNALKDNTSRLTTSKDDSSKYNIYGKLPWTEVMKAIRQALSGSMALEWADKARDEVRLGKKSAQLMDRWLDRPFIHRHYRHSWLSRSRKNKRPVFRDEARLNEAIRQSRGSMSGQLKAGVNSGHAVTLLHP